MDSSEQFHLGFNLLIPSVPLMAFLSILFTYTGWLPYYVSFILLIPSGIGIFLMVTEPTDKPKLEIEKQ